jgi:cyanophycinase-like exopeptidase
MRHASIVFASIVLFCLNCAAFATDAPEQHPYRYYVTGNAADVQRPTRGLFVLQGGGDDVDHNYVHMGEMGGGGDFVVLRASHDGEYNDYIYKLCKCDSVETLVVDTRAAASDPFVINKVRSAEALWISGGDQGDYINWWKDTPLQDAINFVVAKPAPIGGTSAGMAVAGEFVYSAIGPDSLTSPEGLGDPFHSNLTLARDFLKLPRLQGIITDQHLHERDRIGRTVTLLARLMKDGWSEHPRAIAADRETAVHIDPATGIAEVFATQKHQTPYAYFMSATEAPQRCERGKPLTMRNVNVYRIVPGGRFDLGAWQGQGGIAYTLSAENGTLKSSRGDIY